MVHVLSDRGKPPNLGWQTHVRNIVRHYAIVVPFFDGDFADQEWEKGDHNVDILLTL